MTFHVSSFYLFTDMTSDQVLERKVAIFEAGTKASLRGLVLLSIEGINATVAGSESSIIEMKTLLCDLGFKGISFKDSVSSFQPFKRFKVNVRREIVTLGKSDLKVPENKNSHLPPKEFHEKLRSGEAVLLDTRNWYETDVGKFKGTLDLKLSEFREFPEKLKNSSIPKDKEILIYCTGGIRCEKAIVEMKNQGFESVYQLDGGILNYLKQFPDGEFEGDCFVFDHRVALNQQLEPSDQFGLCPHCGQPGTKAIECLRCEHPTKICDACASEISRQTCSKNCAHHYRMRPGVKGPHQKNPLL